MKMMERLPTLLMAVLCLGILAVCDIKEAEANNNSAANAILGGWENSNYTVNNRFDRNTWSSYGGGGTEERYTFHENGTFEYLIITIGYGLGSRAGWVNEKGKYRISGNQITFYEKLASHRDTNNISNSYEDKPVRDQTFRFELVRDNSTGETKLKIQNPTGSYDIFSRQKNNKNQSNQAGGGESFESIKREAERGNADAQYKLGVMYANGQGVTRNDAEAVKWYAKSAGQGHAGAQIDLGFMYFNGRGVAQNDAEAVKWYKKAAEQGNAVAQYNLGFMYANGRGITQNDAEAVKWFVKSAEQGHSPAQNGLGFMYENGRGVAQNDAEAVKWYKKAAEQGNKNAQAALDDMKNQTPTAQGKQSDQPSYVKARHQFKRITPISKSVDEQLNGMNHLNEAEKEEMKAWLNPMMDMIQAEAKKIGRQEDVSVAVALAFCFAYEIFYAEDFGKKFGGDKFELIAKSLDQVLGKDPTFDKMTDAQKQKFVDAILIGSALLLKGYKDVSKLQDLKAIEEAKDAMRQLTQTFGMDEKNLKPSLEKMANLN